MDDGFNLNGSTLLAITGVVGALSGAVGVLFKALMASKDEQIKAWQQRAEASDRRVATLLPAIERLTEAVTKAMAQRAVDR